MDKWKEFKNFNFDNYDVSNKKSCCQLYDDFNKIGFYADILCIKIVGDNNKNFFRNQFSDISTNVNYNNFSTSSIGNFAISLTILDDSDLELKKHIFTTLKNYQKWLNKQHSKFHCVLI